VADIVKDHHAIILILYNSYLIPRLHVLQFLVFMHRFLYHPTFSHLFLLEIAVLLSINKYRIIALE
jgi:hypothetical protein